MEYISKPICDFIDFTIDTYQLIRIIDNNNYKIFLTLKFYCLMCYNYVNSIKFDIFKLKIMLFYCYFIKYFTVFKEYIRNHYMNNKIIYLGNDLAIYKLNINNKIINILIDLEHLNRTKFISSIAHNKKSYHNLTNQINNTFVINNINNDYLDKYFYDKKSKYVLENTDEELNDVIFNNVSEKILKL